MNEEGGKSALPVQDQGRNADQSKPSSTTVSEAAPSTDANSNGSGASNANNCSTPTKKEDGQQGESTRENDSEQSSKTNPVPQGLFAADRDTGLSSGMIKAAFVASLLGTLINTALMISGLPAYPDLGMALAAAVLAVVLCNFNMWLITGILLSRPDDPRSIVWFLLLIFWLSLLITSIALDFAALSMPSYLLTYVTAFASAIIFSTAPLALSVFSRKVRPLIPKRKHIKTKRYRS